MSLLPDNGAGMCEERYSGRKEAFDELDGAETLKGLLQKEVSMFLAGLDPHQLSQEDQCPFCPWFRVKKSEGALYWHVFAFHNAERHFTCSGTKQLTARY